MKRRKLCEVVSIWGREFGRICEASLTFYICDCRVDWFEERRENGQKDRPQIESMKSKPVD
jgi:hypothetical protein